MLAVRLVVPLLFLGACVTPGGDGSTDAADPTGGSTSGASTAPTSSTSGADPTGGGTGPLPPGPEKPGWEKAFNPEPIGINCNQSEDQIAAAGAASLSFGTSSIYVGFEQNGENQNPVFVRFDGGAQVYCEHHEGEAPDGRAHGLTWDGGPVAYVVYTVVGGGTALEAKAEGGWLDRYGDGGGSAKVSYVGEVETQFGTLVRGTFVIAKKQDGKTNTHNPADAPTMLESGELEFRGESAFQPMNPDRTIMECTDYPFHTRYVFSTDLAQLICSSSTNCTSTNPCE